MIRIRVSIIFVLCVSFLKAQTNTYKLSGTFSDNSNDGETIYLKTYDIFQGYILRDSTSVFNRSFNFDGLADSYPQVGLLSIGMDDERVSLFVLEPGEIKIKLGQDIKFGGTKGNDDFYKYYCDQRDYINQLLVLKDELGAVQLLNDTSYFKLKERMKVTTFQFLSTNMQNRIGELFFIDAASNSERLLDNVQIMELLKLANPEFVQSSYVRYIRESIEPSDDVSFKDLKLYDLAGNIVFLNQYIGKSDYLLLDFWASWCGPCRNDMPTLAKLYAEYRSKGLEIVGVSLDDSKDDWNAAVIELGLSWVQLSDLEEGRGRTAQAYAIRSIPMTLLLNKKGEAVAKNLRGQLLEDKIRELIK